MIAAVTTTSALGGGGISWWQTAGGFVAVFGLLLLCLKLLSKVNKGSRESDSARILTVWNLGPKREIQVLRLGDDVHYIYRHDNAMVLLQQTSYAAFEEAQCRTGEANGSTGLKRFLPAVFGLSGGHVGVQRSLSNS